MNLRPSPLPLILVLSALCAARPILADEEPAKKKPTTIAVFDLGAAITEKPTPDDPLFGTIGSESLRSVTSRIEKAASDEDVAAVVLLIGTSGFDAGRLEEFRQAISRVKEQKPVYAHADSVTTGTYALMSGASRLSITPTGDAWINGLYGEQLYLRGLLDLLGVEPDFLTCGDYKSAAEMFMREGPSEEAAEMTDWLFDGLIASVENQIVTGRGVERTQVQAWINDGLFSAEKALESGLIDAVETRGALTKFIKNEHGAVVTFDKKFGKRSGPELDLNNPFAAFQLWAQILGGTTTRRSTKDALAVVYIDGAIMLGKQEVSPFGSIEGAYSEAIRKAIDEVAAEPRVKGIVLRVNSPGGSATASEIMLQAALRAQAKKPVIVSMGSVAGSGGYYVSCRADRIFANEATITGSIGVVGGKLATDKMWRRIGINFEPVLRGAKSGMLKSSLPFTDEERTELQAWMDTIYEVFKGHVVAGRGERLTKEIDDIAGGRVYTGAQALELGLIDEIGTLDDAIEYLVNEVNLEDYEIRSVPRPMNILEQLFADLTPQKEKDNRRLSTDLWSALQPLLTGIDPERMQMVRNAFVQLDFVQQEKVMLTMPVLWVR